MDLFIFDTLGTKKFPKNNVKYKQSTAIEMAEVERSSDVVEVEDQDQNQGDMEDSEVESDMDFGALGPPTDNSSKIIAESLQRENEKKSKLNKRSNAANSVDKFIDSMGWNKPIEKINSNVKHHFENIASKLDTDILSNDVKKEIEKTKNKGIEKNSTNLAKPNIKQIKKLNRIERAKTKGSNWYNLPATEVTENIENDLKILQMRSALDPKHFYKKNDLKVLPKYFQIGTVQHSPLDHYSERHIRKNKKKTIVDELMADAEFNQYTKRKYKEVITKRQNQGYHKALKKMKKLKKNK